MITKSIERAQKKVEENNFATRKRLLEYDDVMNSQREVIYTRRRHALYGDRLAVDISNAFYDSVESMVSEFQDNKNYEGFSLEMIKMFSIECPVAEEKFFKTNKEDLINLLFDAVQNHYHQKNNHLAELAFPAIKNVYENQAHLYENIVFPITDGLKTMQVVINLKKAFDGKGQELISGIEKGVVLNIIDDYWKEHLREMDELKQSVQNAVYEQKDPLLVYKFESFNLFKNMVDAMNKEIASFLIKAFLPQESQKEVKTVKAPEKTDLSKVKISRTDNISSTGGGTPNYTSSDGGEEEKPKLQPIRAEKTVGRNDPCPCGSGKKFKSCHGLNA
jgi:preprotein translocase subunit SecA